MPADFDRWLAASHARHGTAWSLNLSDLTTALDAAAQDGLDTRALAELASAH